MPAWLTTVPQACCHSVHAPCSSEPPIEVLTRALINPRRQLCAPNGPGALQELPLVDVVERRRIDRVLVWAGAAKVLGPGLAADVEEEWDRDDVVRHHHEDVRLHRQPLGLLERVDGPGQGE